MEQEGLWLSSAEERLWQAWIDVSWRIERRVGEQIRRDGGISHNEYAILALLSQSPGRAARMSTISGVAQIPRTRLTHQVDRLERLGVVRRGSSADDARVIMVELTDEGAELLARAAPCHVRTVRAALLDALDSEQVDTLTGLLELVLAHLEGSQAAEG
ncbi:MarR family transcriptional regulator [Streptomyces sp900129855]|jgi:DNA-binding MarR family transcriptional regulator|uniref:MarR family transcriptional regulator n=1 Tax=Streptomyces sp. 900129855 TaxID=3155129 RepID=A0ABV2ZB21_9ACTN